MAGLAVAVHGVRMAYGSFVVLEDVDLAVADGEIVAVTGVNGVGKSTLLSCLAGLRQPAAGAVAAVLSAVLVQPVERWRFRIRAVGGAVCVAAVTGTVTSERWTAVSRTVTDRFAVLSSGTLGLIAAVAVAAACIAALLVWWTLPRFPASVIRADSARAGTTLMAAAFLNIPLLTWIAEDTYWRGRMPTSRP